MGLQINLSLVITASFLILIFAESSGPTTVGPTINEWITIEIDYSVGTIHSRVTLFMSHDWWMFQMTNHQFIYCLVPLGRGSHGLACSDNGDVYFDE
jgi:hypothetical protein